MLKNLLYIPGIKILVFPYTMKISFEYKLHLGDDAYRPKIRNLGFLLLIYSI